MSRISLPSPAALGLGIAVALVFIAGIGGVTGVVGAAAIADGPSADAVSPTAVDVGDTITVEYTANGTDVEEVRLVVTAPSGVEAYNESVDQGVNEEAAISQAALDPYEEGDYDVTVWVKDTANETATDTKTDAFSVSGSVTDGPVLLDVAPDLVQADESLELSYRADGQNLDSVTLVAEGPTGDTLSASVPLTTDGTHTFDRSQLADLEPGAYDVTIIVDDIFGGQTTETYTDAFEIGQIYDPDAATINTAGTGVAGDFLTIDVTLSDIDEGYLLIGGYGPEATAPNAQFDVLHVDGSATIAVNTRLMWSDRPGEDVYTALAGSVTSYVHDVGATNEPSGVFEDLRFVDESGDEIADTLAEYQAWLGIGGQVEPLQAGEYTAILGHGDLIARDDRTPDPQYPKDRDTFELTEPELGELSLYALPEGNANELQHEPDPDQLQEMGVTEAGTLQNLATTAETIRVGERIMVEFEADGLWGSMVDSLDDPDGITDARATVLTPQEMATLFERDEGISLELLHTNPGPNEQAIPLDIFEADVDDVAFYIEPAPGPAWLDEPGTISMVIDTRAPGLFEDLEGGEVFELSVAYESDLGAEFEYETIELGHLPDPYAQAPPGGQYPYFDAGDTTEQRTVSWDVVPEHFTYHNTDPEGNVVVINDTNALITGNTTYHPNSDPIDLIIDHRYRPISVEIEDVDIGPDGEFAETVDLSMVNTDDEVVIEFWAYEELIDRRDLAIFADQSDVSHFAVTDLRTDAMLVGDEIRTDVLATIENTGTLPDEATVELLIDGDVIETHELSLDRNEDRIIHFENATDLGEGTHPIEVRTPDESERQLLVAENLEPIYEVDSIEATSAIENDTRVTNLTASITNTGGVTGLETIELRVDNSTLALTSQQIFPGETETVEFSDAVGELDAGEYELEVVTPNESATTTLTIPALDDTLAVADLTVTSPIEPGDELFASATINHTGTITATGPVELSLGNESIETWDVELTPGEALPIDVDNVTVDREPGNYTVTVTTPTDNATATLVVEEPPEPDQPGDDTEEPAPAEDDEDDGLLGLGIGRRETIGGTIVVGAIHLLGHWV